MLLTRFFYDDGAGDAGGGNTPDNQAPVTIPEDIQKELNELRAYRDANKPAEIKTPEQIAKESQTRQADFIKYSVEEELMKVEDFNKYETLTTKADRELVYENWIESWKAENPEVPESEISERAKADFESEYKLDNEKSKARGEAKLKREADEIRNPVVNSYKEAQKQFDGYQKLKNSYPAFDKAVDDIVKESVPDELVYKTKEKDKDGVEQEITIDGVKLTAEDKKEIAKVFKSNKNLISFAQKGSDPAALKKLIADKIQGFLTVKYAPQIQAAIYQKAKEIGIASGSDVGAKNPFGLLNKNEGQQGAQVIEMNTEKANAAANKYRKNR